MLKGLGRSPFGPRPTPGGPPPADGPPAATPTGASPPPGPPPGASPPPPPARLKEAPKEADPAEEAYETLKRHIHMRLVDRLDMNRVSEMDPNTLRSEIRGVVEHLCDTENPLLNRNERQRLVSEILDETFGFGPLELLLKDEKIADIMINGPEEDLRREGGPDPAVGGRLPRQRAPAPDHRPDRLARRPPGRRDLADGRRPAAQRLAVQRDHPAAGPRRRRGHDPDVRLASRIGKDDLLRFKAFTPEMLALMEGAMKARLNVIISGGTGSGKTTLLNTLSSFIQPDHRVITIEDAAELQLQQDHVVRLETRPPNIEGRGAVTATDLVKNALRMRPDRIIIGECRGAETLDMIQAMNTGHEGSMTTVHANTPARRPEPARDDDQHGRPGAADPRPAVAVRLGRRPDHPGEPAPGRPAQGDEHLRGRRHGGRHDHHAGDLRLPAGGRRRQRPRLRRVHRHRHPADLHGPARIRRLPPHARRLPPAGAA